MVETKPAAKKPEPVKQTDTETAKVDSVSDRPGGTETDATSETRDDLPVLKERWVMNQFFAPSFTKNMTLQELRNTQNQSTVGMYDATDRDIARELLNRANLSEHHRFNELLEYLTDVFSQIANPRTWVNPNAEFLDERR